MANMSYCRFQNTVPDLQDCLDAIEDELSSEESRARLRLISLCAELFDTLGVEYSEEDLARAKERLS